MITREEMEIQLADLEALLEEVSGLIDDAELTDADFRDEVRALVLGDDDNE